MKTKMYGNCRLLIPFLLVLEACGQEPAPQASDIIEGEVSITVKALLTDTKTTMEDEGDRSVFSFAHGDEIGLYADEARLTNTYLSYSESTDEFSGSFRVTGSSLTPSIGVNYYAYYPYDKRTSGASTVIGILPSVQNAPFDPRYDYMVASPSQDRFDIDDFPVLSFTFNKHLFAIVKLSITNADPVLADEKLLAIGLKSNGAPLCGEFSFDVTAATPAADFTTDPDYLFNRVLLEYDKADLPSLGVGVTHSVYAIVRPGNFDASDLHLLVNTENYNYELPSEAAAQLKQNQVTVLPSIALSDVRLSKNEKKRMVLWGDSITTEAFQSAVQHQLGSGWEVYRGGVAADGSQIITARQGGLPITTGTEFELPASSEDYVDFDGLFWHDNESEGQVITSYTFQSTESSLLNPLIICGIECEAAYDAERGQRMIRRLENGSKVTIPAGSSVSTFGSRTYRDVDVMVVYMGSNGAPGAENLIRWHDLMKTHLTNENAKMLVLGYQHSPTDYPYYYWGNYVDKMTDYYKEYFVNQRALAGGWDNAIPLMYELGQITDESDVPSKDRPYLDRGDWPLSWLRNNQKNVHPNDQYGAMVQAILLRRRMVELGLL